MSLVTSAVIGPPGSGKSHVVMTALRRLIGPVRPFKYGRLQGTYHEAEGLYVLGLYGGHAFPGTDRLSMTAHVDAVRFYEQSGAVGGVLWEGDRLSLAKVLDAARAAGELHLFVVQPADEVYAKRRAARTQNDAWVRGRVTKVRKLADAYPHTTLRNDSPEDAEAAASAILKPVVS